MRFFIPTAENFIRPGGLFAILAVFLLAGACAQVPRTVDPAAHLPEPSTPRPSEPSAPEPSSKSSDRFKIVTPKPGDSFASLAREHLGDPDLDWLIAELNGGLFPAEGHDVVVPLVPLERGGLGARGYQLVPVLCYHKFSKTKGDLMTVTEKAFEEQMGYLKKNGYRVLTVDRFFDFLEFTGQVPRKSVVITIDDGWRSFYEIAFPILKKYGYPATMFIYTDFIIGGGKALDWGMVREMAQNGIDIQCHSKTHRSLTKRAANETVRQYFEAVQRELTDSARIIKSRVGTDVRYLAYPYQDTNHTVIALLSKLGYRGAFTVERGGAPFFVHPYRINRCMIYGTFDIEDFKSNLKTFEHHTLKIE